MPSRGYCFFRRGKWENLPWGSLDRLISDFALHPRLTRRNRTQTGKNLGCWHSLGFTCIETRDPFRYFSIPSGVCAGFRIRLDADKEPVSDGNPLIGRKPARFLAIRYQSPHPLGYSGKALLAGSNPD